MPRLSYNTPEPLRVVLTGLFRRWLVGRDNAMTLKRLLQRTDVKRHDGNGRLVRKAIAELIIIDKLPIAGDSTAGYYFCATEAERNAQCRQLGRRIRALGLRMRTFVAAFDKEQGEQRTLDYDSSADERAVQQKWLDGVIEALGDLDDEEDEDV